MALEEAENAKRKLGKELDTCNVSLDMLKNTNAKLEKAKTKLQCEVYTS